jgi:hypothetical protein
LKQADMRRSPEGMRTVLSHGQDALALIGKAIGRGDGDREALLALAALVVARLRLLERAIDLRQSTRATS